MPERLKISYEDHEPTTPPDSAIIARFVVPRFVVRKSPKGSDAPGTLVGEDLAKPRTTIEAPEEEKKRIHIPVEGYDPPEIVIKLR